LTLARLPQLSIEHQARDLFFDVSRKAQRQSSARHVFIRSQMPSTISS